MQRPTTSNCGVHSKVNVAVVLRGRVEAGGTHVTVSLQAWATWSLAESTVGP
jgi:hypothetical protein